VILELEENMAPLIWSVLDRMLLAAVLIGLVVMGNRLTQMQSETTWQIQTLARHMASAETRDTAAEDRDRVLEQQISALAQQRTQQLDKMEAVLTSCARAEH
jgi:hypothetical protein